MKLLSFYNIKGGVGKTSLTTLVSYKLSTEGKKVLIIDVDAQANLTQNIYKNNHIDKTMMNAILEDAAADELIIKKPNKKYPGVDIIPSDIQLSYLSEEMALAEDKDILIAKWLKNNMGTLKAYDYIFIDLSPNIDLLMRNIIYILDSLIITLEYGDLASLKGSELLYKLYLGGIEKLEIEDTCKKVVLINQYKSYKRKILDLFDKQLDEYKFTKTHLLDTKLNDSTSIQQAIVLKLGLSDLHNSFKNKKIEKQLDILVDELKEKEIL